MSELGWSAAGWGEPANPAAAEQAARDFERWSPLLVPSGPTDRRLVKSAVDRLYKRIGLPPPAVLFCQSFYQLLTLPSLLIGMLHSDTWQFIAEELKAHCQTRDFSAHWNRAWPEIWANCGFPLLEGMNRTSRIAEFHGNLEGALISQAKREIGAALGSGRLDAFAGTLKREIYRRFWAPNKRSGHHAISFANNLKYDVYAEMTYAQNSDGTWDGWDDLKAADVALTANGTRIAGTFSQFANRLGAEAGAQAAAVLPVPAAVPWLFTAQSLLERYPHLLSRLKGDLKIWQDLGAGCSAILALDGLVFACEKPTAFHLTPQWRLHNESGPALTYSDGFEVYAWQGVIVNRRIIEQPQSITVAQIEANDNAEVRRVMLERYGLTRYLEDSGIEPAQQDECGVLYRKELPGDETLVMVKVVNSTPEPDGTYKHYFLRVPPGMETAKQAVAWTFGMEEDEYAPAVQT